MTVRARRSRDDATGSAEADGSSGSPLSPELLGFRPIFVVGSPRSGKQVVYSLLLASGEFLLYEEGETHLLEARPHYGPLTRGDNYRRFIDDWQASKQFGRSPLSPDSFEERAREYRSSYPEFLGFFMAEMARRQGASRWVERTPGHVHHVGELAEAFPESRFVHVIRDGRDSAASMHKMGWVGTRSSDPVKRLVGAGKSWERCVRAGRAAGEELGDDRYTEVRYEELVTEPAGVIERLSRFADCRIGGVSAVESGIGALGGGHSSHDGRLEGLSTRPVGRWKRRLDDRQKAVVNLAIDDALRTFGYPVAEVEAGRLFRWRVRRLALEVELELGLKAWFRERTPLGRLAEKRLDFHE